MPRYCDVLAHHVGYLVRRGDLSCVSAPDVSSVCSERPPSSADDYEPPARRRRLAEEDVTGSLAPSSPLPEPLEQPTGDLTVSRSGPYAASAVPPVLLWTAVIEAWSALRVPAGERAALDAALRTLRGVPSTEADVLAGALRPFERDGLRVYLVPPGAATAELQQALRAAERWGLALASVACAEAIAERDSALLLLDEAERTPVAVAAWRELIGAEARRPYVPGVIDFARLQDGEEVITLGAHAATLPPERVRGALACVSRRLGSLWAKRNKVVVLGSGAWARRYASRPAGQPSRRTRRGRGGGDPRPQSSLPPKGQGRPQPPTVSRPQG